MEKTNGIWTQKMLMKIERNMINIMDHENKVNMELCMELFGRGGMNNKIGFIVKQI